MPTETEGSPFTTYTDRDKNMADLNEQVGKIFPRPLLLRTSLAS
jgi:hypothetical protein